MGLSAIIPILGSALSIWEHKEKNKYFEEYRELVKILSNEWAKKEAWDNRESDDAEIDFDLGLIDRSSFELELLANRVSQKINENSG